MEGAGLDGHMGAGRSQLLCGCARRCLRNYSNDHMKQPRQGPKSASDSVLHIQIQKRSLFPLLVRLN